MTEQAGERIRVVLADDVAPYRLLVRLLLEADGRFEIVGEASDGAEAVRICAKERPHVVLLDLAMPKLDGLQAIPRIQAESPATRIVVLSGFARDQLERQVLSSGACAYLEKGANVSSIASTLVTLVPETALPSAATSAAP